MRGRAERALNFPPTVQTGREALCVSMDPSQTTFMQLKPLNTRTSNQNVSESQTAKKVSVASGADLVCLRGGPTPITCYLSVHYLWSQSVSSDTGPLCIFLPALSLNPLAAPVPPVFSTERIFSAGLPLLLKNTIVSMVPFFSPSAPVLLVRLWLEEAWRHVCRPHENLSLFFLQRPLHTNLQLILLLRHPV